MVRTPECALVIFGATGDLTKKKLIPALYTLHIKERLHKNTVIYAIGRRDYDDKDIHKEFKSTLGKTVKKQWESFCKRVTYHKLEFADIEAYRALGEKLTQSNRIFYLATPPAAFSVIVSNLNTSGVARRRPKRGWHRVVFEKPFGSDLKSAKKLNKDIRKLFDEKQIYRIDHYVGKNFVQQILTIRFANPVFGPVWNNKYIESVELVVSETGGVGTRSGYYDHAGAIRDIFQNHLLQLVSLIAMEQPKTLSAQDIRKEKARVLHAVKTSDVVVGQYTAGNKIPSYRNEKGVAKNSLTETFVALNLCVRNNRWKKVPFHLRTGKGLLHRYAEIVIKFKMDCALFCNPYKESHDNILIIRIQPDEGVKFLFNILTDDGIVPQSMTYLHDAVGQNTPEAYELLLTECLQGNQTLFTSWDFVKWSWKITDALRRRAKHLIFYKAGTHGPDEALEINKNWMGNQEIL